MRQSLLVLLLISLLSFTGFASAEWEDGVAAFRTGDHDRAAQEFRSVVDSNPDFAGGHFMLAQALLNLNGSDEALTHFRKAYELDRSNVSYQFALARAYLADDRSGEAAQMLQKIDPSSLPPAQQGEYQQMFGRAMENNTSSDGGVQSEVDLHDFRIEEQNRRIAEENAEIERENVEIEAMEREREALERELKDLGGVDPP